MNAIISEQPWSEQSLFNKARLYIEHIESQPHDSSSGLWSALSLELLARAALSHISPVLLAGEKNWRNLMYALGRQPTKRGFTPVSISAKQLFDRVSELVPEFTNEDHGFCLKHVGRRNMELHSGELAFEDIPDWWPRFYQACKILVESMDRQLKDLISDAETAQAMIESLKDATAKSVLKDIDEHQRVWRNKSEKERERALLDAKKHATATMGHRVECPACKSSALVKGTPFGAVDTRIDGSEIVEKQGMFPSSFECIACGLRISGLSKLSACGLGNTFIETVRYAVEEYYSDYWADYPFDMNE